MSLTLILFISFHPFPLLTSPFIPFLSDSPCQHLLHSLFPLKRSFPVLPSFPPLPSFPVLSSPLTHHQIGFSARPP